MLLKTVTDSVSSLAVIQMVEYTMEKKYLLLQPINQISSLPLKALWELKMQDGACITIPVTQSQFI